MQAMFNVPGISSDEWLEENQWMDIKDEEVIDDFDISK